VFHSVFFLFFSANPSAVLKEIIVVNNVEVDVILASCFSYPNIISMATGMMKEITRGGGNLF
jgi:hypothetical protein